MIDRKAACQEYFLAVGEGDPVTENMVSGGVVYCLLSGSTGGV